MYFIKRIMMNTVSNLCGKYLMFPFQSQTEEGVFGSKFVTVCITGNKDCEVEMMAYQVR